jgi:hypothetical protein
MPTQFACRVLDVSNAASMHAHPRTLRCGLLRLAWLREQIHHIHATSRGTYGARRVHAELVLGRRITVGNNAVEM